MDWKRPDGANLTLASEQGEYHTIYTRREVGTFARVDNGETYQQVSVVARIRPTADELRRLNEGEDLYLSIAGGGWPPVLLCVGDPNPEVAALYGKPDNGGSQPDPDEDPDPLAGSGPPFE